MGFRDMYGKQEIHNVDDLKNVKVRVQATATEDTMFPAYGAQTVHMPFGDVYTALQTGIVAMAENGINVYQSNKHYEVAPIMSLTQHEANNNVDLGQRQGVEQPQRRTEGLGAGSRRRGRTKVEPEKALRPRARLDGEAEKMGVKFVKDVDKSGFIKDAEPFQDKLAAQLGPGRRQGAEAGPRRQIAPAPRPATALTNVQAPSYSPGRSTASVISNGARSTGSSRC